MKQNILIIINSLFLVSILIWVFNDNTQQTPQTKVEPRAENEPKASEPETATEARTGEDDGRQLETIRDAEHECLALNVYHESRSDNFSGRIAVADVVINRVESSLFPNTICGVVQHAKTRINWKGNEVPVRGMCHFSWYCDGQSDEPMEEDSWEDAQIIADMILRGGFRGISEGATHYHATYVTPNWIGDRGMVPVGRIGLHKFYRWH